MRDAHRMKEKFDLSLDNRQIVSLLIASIVVMGAVFVLGVVVGKKLAGNAQTATAQDLLSAIDAKAEALEQVQQEPALTFPDELTRRTPSEPALPSQPPAPAAKAVAPKAPAAAEPAPQAPAEQPREPEEAPVQRLAEAPAPAPVREEAPRGKVAEAPVTARTAAPDGGLKSAIARAQQQAPAASRPAGVSAGGTFTLQLSAYQARAEAERFAARLRDRGYAPYIVAAQVPGKGTWHRVRMGSFASKEAAARYLADFKRETQLAAFVTSR
jgi:DedD protein